VAFRPCNDLLEDLATAERAVRSVKERLAQASGKKPKSDDSIPPEDESAFRPAHEVLAVIGQFKTPRQLRAFLDKHPSIRRRRPSPFRLRIHTGELVAQIAKMNLAKFQAADVPVATAAHFADEVRAANAGQLKSAR
jgi:hypothetical protein